MSNSDLPPVHDETELMAPDGSGTEYRVLGPPGTGKTNWVAKQMEKAEKRYGPGSVLATSFSRATAATLASRNTDLGSPQIGTLHSICFHALGKPPLAEVYVDDWNHSNPGLTITPASKQAKLNSEDSAEDHSLSCGRGDALLHDVNRRRSLMEPVATWPDDVVAFYRKWCGYKQANGLMDFNDLIEVALKDLLHAPGKPTAIFADEAQDLTPMLAALVRHWGRSADYYVFAGDDDQVLYSWAGATPDVLIDPIIPGERTVYLQQSHRVPAAVHLVADRIAQRITRRQEKRYEPRPTHGSVIRLPGTYKSPEYQILKTAGRHLAEGKSVAFLATCAYMVKPTIAALRKAGIGYHNPYRKSNGFWNPLRSGSRQSATSRLGALLAPINDPLKPDQQWTAGQVSLWAGWLSSAFIQPGSLKRLASLLRSQKIDEQELHALFGSAMAGSLSSSRARGGGALLEWWRAHLAPQYRRRAEFPIQVLRRSGCNAADHDPRVVVGTIHSIKGGEVDVVYLFPDLSAAGDALYQRSGPSRDSVLRTFYVGATRARETLYICDSATAARAEI